MQDGRIFSLPKRGTLAFPLVGWSPSADDLESLSLVVLVILLLGSIRVLFP